MEKELMVKAILRCFVIDKLITNIPKGIYSFKDMYFLQLYILLNIPENVWILYTSTQYNIALELIKKPEKKKQLLNFLHSLIVYE